MGELNLFSCRVFVMDMNYYVSINYKITLNPTDSAWHRISCVKVTHIITTAEIIDLSG